MRAKPSSNTRAGKSNRANVKSNGVNPKVILKKSKDTGKKVIPDLSILRQPVDTSICGLKQAVKVFETGTPEVLHLLTYDCDVVYECKVCRNLFRSIANFISHKRVYCTLRYSRSQDLRSNKEGENYTVIVGDKAKERLPTRITARKDLTSIVESLGAHNPSSELYSGAGQNGTEGNTERKSTTVHLEPMENTSYGVFQTVLKPDSQNLMRNQVTELQNLLAQNEVVLGPDGRILQNGFTDLHKEETEVETNDENGLVCSECNIKFANRKTLTKHKRMMHESVRTSYSCPCCKNYFANPWSVYRHLYKVHRKTNEQVRRLRSQIHKKEVRVEKPVVNSVSNKKVTTPNKKKGETEHHLRIHQDNKEWMDHFEDDWELQRCGGCGRKFERKAALISHSQICQKRIAACNRIEQNHQRAVVVNNVVPVVALSPLPCSKKPVPKPTPEKKIGIQVRMNYCKNSPTTSHVSGLQRNCSRSLISDESDIETVSVDGKESFFHQGPMRSAVDMKEGAVLEELKNASKFHAPEAVAKVSSFLNNAVNSIGKGHTYEISTCKRSSFLRINVGKSKSLEAKCLQLRSALESGRSDTLKTEDKVKDVENTVYFDGSLDNTSESNTSAISSLSSQLTPLVDKGYVCEVEQSIEIKNINTSRTLDNVPITEADSTSMTSGGNVQITYNTHTFKENIKLSPPVNTTCEEVSTSVISDVVHQTDSNLNVDSSSLSDDEVSVDLKPVYLEPKNSIQGNELENTISILTRNQLKAICKDDLVPNNDSKKVSPGNVTKKKSKIDTEFRTVTKEILQKKLGKYTDRGRNICLLCNKKFKRIQNLHRHIPIHTHWKRYECLFSGCTFQTFLRSSCYDHVITHTKENSGKSPDSLVGIINSSKWNIRLIQKPKNLPKLKTVAKVSSGSKTRSKAVASQKLVKTVNRLAKKSVNSTTKSEKGKLKSKTNAQNETKKGKISRLLNKVNTKQKLLTDFKNFREINAKSILQEKKIEEKESQSPKRKNPVNNVAKRRLKFSVVENGVSVKEPSSSITDKSTVKRQRISNNTSDSPKAKPLMAKKEISEDIIMLNDVTSDNSEKSTLKKQRLSTNNTDPSRVKSPVIKREVKDDEIIINHVTSDNEPSIGKSRGSRVSSRKSSVNSVDQQKGKNIINPVVKPEDSNMMLHLAPESDETQNSINIQNPEIVDGSLEEEESQESDKPVDDSHLKKIFMEVIFGPPTPSPSTNSVAVQSPGRPLRNKSRPKRDSDFIIGSDRDISDGKSSSNKRSIKSVSDAKTVTELTRKSKQ